MKKNEYVAPEMEIVELIGKCTILDASNGNTGGPKDPDEELPDFPFPGN